MPGERRTYSCHARTCKITIIKRSKQRIRCFCRRLPERRERLFSEYDQEQKYYSLQEAKSPTKKSCSRPMRRRSSQTAIPYGTQPKRMEKQWNSQLARRFVLAIPREIPPGQYADLIRDYCREFFVSKGMIADFAIHDKGDGNPHAHILLHHAGDGRNRANGSPRAVRCTTLTRTASASGLRPADGKAIRRTPWTGTTGSTPKSGGRDGRTRRTAIWKPIDRPERLDLRSYARQGIDQIPTVHMGASRQPDGEERHPDQHRQPEPGHQSRQFRLMQSIRQMVRSLKGWLSGLKEKKAALLEALEQAKEPTTPRTAIPGIWIQRSEERADWTSKGKLKGTVADFNKVHGGDGLPAAERESPPWRALTPGWMKSAQTAVSVMGEHEKKREAG